MNHQEKTVSRRKMLEMAVALGGLAVTHPMYRLFAQEAKRHLTPEQIMGPFYPIVKPLDDDADLTVIKGKSGRAQGKVIHLMGRVLNSNGEPVRGAKLELWQANMFGRYAHPTDVNPALLDPNFQGFSVQTTDSEGRFRFKTIKPGAYPINPINPNNMRPPHIHFDIRGKSDRLVTQMYFPGEPLNEEDFLFKQLGDDQDAAIGKVLPPTKDLEPDSMIVAWDIVLERG